MTECTNCSAKDATYPVTINKANPKKNQENVLTNEDVPWDVQFSGEDEVSSTTVCKSCHRDLP